MWITQLLQQPNFRLKKTLPSAGFLIINMSMKNIIAILTVDSNRLNNLIDHAADNFLEMQLDSHHEVDIKSCLDCYISALLTYNQTLFKVVI